MELMIIGILLLLFGGIAWFAVNLVEQRATKCRTKAQQQWQARQEATAQYIEARAREYYQRQDAAHRFSWLS